MANTDKHQYEEARARSADATEGLIERLEGMAEPTRRAADAYRLVLPVVERMRQEIAQDGAVSPATVSDWAKVQGIATVALNAHASALKAMSAMVDRHAEVFRDLGPFLLSDMESAKTGGVR